MAEDKGTMSMRKNIELLYRCFSERTTILALPPGTKEWSYMVFEPSGKPLSLLDADFKKRTVTLEPFFGVMMAYIHECDTLVYWLIEMEKL